MDTAAIEALADWSAPREIRTKNGPRILRTAKPNDNFSALWRSQAQAEMRAAGLAFSKNNYKSPPEWEIAWWQPLPQAEQEQRAESVAASKRSAADLDLPAPAGLAYMPFQKAGIAYALTREHGHCLIADEPGLGKTIQACGIVNADPQINSALIVCPKSLKLNWLREATKWITRSLSIGVADQAWPATDIVIVNYEGLRKFDQQAHAQEWGALIIDEAHYIKNPKTQRAILIKGRKASPAKKGKPAVAAVAPIMAKRHIRLTGTPIVNRPIELHPIIEDLHPAWANFFAFAKRYCNAQQIQAGRKTVWDFSGSSNLDELQQRLRETIMVRRLKADVLPELPRKIRQVIELDPEDAGARRLIAAGNRLESDWNQRIDSLRGEAIMAQAGDPAAYAAAVAALREAEEIAFTEISANRHATAIAKIPAICDFLSDAMAEDPDKKIIVGAHHHDMIRAIAAYAADQGWGPVTLTGEISADADRQAAVDQFQNDPACRLFIGSILAAGVGITLTASSHVIFAELDWVPGNVTQFEDRAHRIGQTDTVLAQHLVYAGSIDARQATLLVAKQAIIDSALDTEHAPRQAPAPRPQAAPKAAPQAPKAPQAEAQQPQADQAPTAPAMTADQIAAAHEAMRILAGMDEDHAQEINGAGFGKFDGAFGHSLATARSLSPKMAAAAAKLANKYRRQLGADLLARIKGDKETRDA